MPQDDAPLSALLSRLDRLEAQVRRLDDIEQIKSLHRRYVRHLADREWERMHAMFDEDVVTDLSFNGETRGRAAMLAMFDRIAAMAVTHDAYVLSSPVIEVDGDHARGEWTWHRHYCDLMTRQGASLQVFGPWMEGRYRCEYVRRADGWKFSRLWFRTVAPDPGLDDRLKAQRAQREGQQP